MTVAIYVRVSTQEQATEGYSIQEQIDRLTKYSQAMKWHIYKVYTDPGFTGSNMDRPGLQLMLKDVKAHRVDRVLVYKLDRLSRSQKDTLNLIEDYFLANGVDFVSLNENFDTSTPFGRAMVGIIAVFAQLEREQIKERLTMGISARAKDGKYHGGSTIPYGYIFKNGDLVVNEHEAMIIKEIFKLAYDGHTVYNIALRLNDRSLLKRGQPWTDAKVRRVLTTRIYAGYITHKGEVFKGQHEAIVDDETFDEVHRILEQRTQIYAKHNRRPGKSTTYLGGFLICGRCGARYSKKTIIRKDGKHHFFQCGSIQKKHPYSVKDPNCKNTDWKVDELTELVFDEIRKLSLDPDRITTIQESDDNIINRQIISDEITSIDSQISKLMDMYTMNDIPKDLLQDKIRSLNDKKTALDAELHDVTERLKSKSLSGSSVKVMVDKFDDILKNGDFDEIKSVISDLIDHIELDGSDVKIFWRF